MVFDNGLPPKECELDGWYFIAADGYERARVNEHIPPKEFYVRDDKILCLKKNDKELSHDEELFAKWEADRNRLTEPQQEEVDKFVEIDYSIPVEE